MAQYLPSINYVLVNEGGFSDNPNDPGGATQFGIEQRAWPDVNIASITRAQAIAWYQTNFWGKAPYPKITSQQVATKLFDMHVNLGLKPAALLAQKAVGFSGMKADGRFEVATVTAINQTPKEAFLSELVSLLGLHYKLLEQRNPKLTVFDKGWMARAKKLPPKDTEVSVRAISA